ncbi:MAG: hypothetical protein VX589_06970 [Myxococcota bacterium]|nr:hypothetical protein [Myxococcota bacterium]
MRLRVIHFTAVWILCAAVCLTVEAPLKPARAESQSLQEVREQALLYFRRDRFKRARIEFERANRLPGGKEDPKVQYYLAQTYRKLGLIDRAFYSAEQSASLSEGSPDLKRATQQLLTSLNEQYGAVLFRADNADSAPDGSILLESSSPIINRDKRRQYETVRERFRSTIVRLPLTTYLPYGRYSANNVAFAVTLGDTTTVNLDLVAIEGAKAAAGARSNRGRTWLWISIGLAAATAAAVGGYYILRDEPPDGPQQIQYPVRIMNLEAR